MNPMFDTFRNPFVAKPTTCLVLALAGLLGAVQVGAQDAAGGIVAPKTVAASRTTVAGDSAWKLAGELASDRARGDGMRQQIMYAILRKNPDAFEGGNVFFLKRGVTLALPTSEEVRVEDAVEVQRQVAEHEANWRKRQRSAPSLYPLGARSAPPALPHPVITPPTAASPPPVVQTPSAPEAPAKPVAEPPKAVEAPVRVLPAEPVPPAATPSAAPAPMAVEPSSASPLRYLFPLALLLGLVVWLWLRRKGTAVPASRKEPPADLSKVLPRIVPVGQMVLAPGGTPVVREIDHHREAAIKLSIGEAYLEFGREAEAREMLQEAATEGNPATRAAAAKALSHIAAPAAAAERLAG